MIISFYQFYVRNKIPYKSWATLKKFIKNLLYLKHLMINYEILFGFIYLSSISLIDQKNFVLTDFNDKIMREVQYKICNE